MAEPTQEQIWEFILVRRGVDVPCPKCSGMGVRAYPNTSTWHHGIGGQMITKGICDACWGSGDAHRHGPNLREMTSRFKSQEAQLKKAEDCIRDVAQHIDVNCDECPCIAKRYFEDKGESYDDVK